MTAADLLLFPEPEVVRADGYQSAPKPVRAPDPLELAGQRALGSTKFEVFRWSVIDDNRTELGMAIPTRDAEGKRVWPDKHGRLTLIVTDAEVAAALKAWEAETGKCSGCGGDGQAFGGWSRDHGYRYVPCTRCATTGLAPIVVLK